MHTVWKGAISFGLVHIPIKMFTATENKSISLRYIHKECGSPLNYVKKCPSCNEEVEWEEITKGYEYDKGRFVTFDKDELEALGEEGGKEIQILDFVDLTDIDPIYFQKTYYLSPGDTGSNAYQLLHQALKQSGKIGIAKMTIRSKTTLAALRTVDHCIVMETIFYPDEIRSVDQVPNLPEKVEANPKELEMAQLLIDQLSGPFEPDKYQDDYRHSMEELIQKKINGEEIKVAPEQERANVVDLMSALKASLEATETTKTTKKDTKAKANKTAKTAAGKTTGTSAKKKKTSKATVS